jgi:hypothetical protein
LFLGSPYLNLREMSVNLPRKICQKLIRESGDISIASPHLLRKSKKAEKRKDGQMPNPRGEYHDAGAS